MASQALLAQEWAARDTATAGAATRGGLIQDARRRSALAVPW